MERWMIQQALAVGMDAEGAAPPPEPAVARQAGGAAAA